MANYLKIEDTSGTIRYWYENDNRITYDYCQYERNVGDGRCYRLDPQGVHRRIKAAEYEDLLHKVKSECLNLSETEKKSLADAEEYIKADVLFYMNRGDIESACQRRGLAVTSNRNNMEMALIRKMVDDYIAGLIAKEGEHTLENY